MNIVTPMPSSIVFTTSNVNTEAARRDNALKDTIPAAKDADQGASEQGLGSESDRARTPGQKLPPLTYERPQIQPEPTLTENPAGESLTSTDKDNARDESAGKDSAEQKQQQNAEKEVDELKSRDEEVRRHEQAHAAAGGQHAGSPQYEYEKGPDGKRYVTDGEVSIDVSEAKSPEDTIAKMEQVRRAALAPAEPSAQDKRVAAEAARKTAEARLEIASQNDKAGNVSDADSQNTGQTQRVQDIGDIAGQVPADRNLERDSETMQSRIGIIQQFYQRSAASRQDAFTASA